MLREMLNGRDAVERARRNAPTGTWRLTAPTRGELCISFRSAVLAYEDVRPLLAWLQKERGRSWQKITFDFADVRDIAAPWTPFFAHLECVASQAATDCWLVGLNARLASMASLVLGDGAPGRIHLGLEGSEHRSQP